jgi:hypothetical protein
MTKWPTIYCGNSKLPQVFDPATVPNVGSSPAEVLHYRLCMGITSIFTNPPTHLERELQDDTIAIAIAIAGAVSSRQIRRPPEHTTTNTLPQHSTASCISLHGQSNQITKVIIVWLTLQ